jgi:hypothetical protein
MHDSNELSTAMPMFWGRVTRLDYCGDRPMTGYTGNQRSRPLTESRYDITFRASNSHFYVDFSVEIILLYIISTSIHDSNEVPTDLAKSLNYWRVNLWGTKLALINIRLMYTIFNSLKVHMPVCFSSSPVV